MLSTLHTLIHYIFIITLWENFHWTDGETGAQCVFYKVVNSGNRIKIQVCLTLHYSSHLPQGSLVSMSSLTAQRQGGRASCGQAKGGHICLSTQRQPSWVRAAHAWQVFFQVSGHTQFRTKEACRRNEWSGAARQVVFIKDPNKNKSGKAKSPNPKGQADDGSKYVLLKGGHGSSLQGS